MQCLRRLAHRRSTILDEGQQPASCEFVFSWAAIGAAADSFSLMQRLERLLRWYRLCMSTSDAHSEDDKSFDFNELSPIALPLRTSFSAWTSTNAEIETESVHVENRDYATTEAHNFNTGCLALPADIGLRFRRLIHTYRLRVVDPTKSTITSLAPSDPSNVSALYRTSTESTEQATTFAKAEPRWMLWCFADGCF